MTRNKYYIIVSEWNYPAESGRDVYSDTFDTKEDAFSKAKELAEKEVDICEYLNGDIINHAPVEEIWGYSLKHKDYPIYFAVRVLEIEMIV